MSKIKKRVLSGIQPSGKLHLGNYFGMMSRMINYQDENDLFCFIVNYHALTTIQNKAELEKNTICLLYTSPSPRDRQKSRMPSSA